MSPLNRLALLVTELTPEEMIRFRRWLDQYEMDRWDAGLDLDMATPKLDEVARSLNVAPKRSAPVARPQAAPGNA